MIIYYYTKKLALLLLTLVFTLLFLPRTSNAAVIFEDDFNSYPNGAFPDKWVNYDSTCNADWYVEDGILKISIAQHPCGENILPNAQNWHELSEYVLDFDILFKSGVDRHVYYRINPEANYIRLIHFTYPNGYIVYKGTGAEGFYRGYAPNTFYHYKYVVTPTNLKIYESSEIIHVPYLVSDINFDSSLLPGFIGLGSGPGSSTLTETWIDNIKVTQIDDSEENGLDVPILKQTNPSWANDIYDSANVWSPLDPTISRWGCAITSAAMVLNYHDVEKLPNGLDLTPSTLNDYLKSVPDGYKRNGETNWKKAADIAKLAKSHNPDFEYDALEFEWGGNNISDLEGDLNNNIPNILQVTMPNGGMHFVVAKGADSGNVLINDPGFNNSDLGSYNDTYSSTRRYIPSNSDLSYIMLVIDPHVTIELRDSSGNVVGNEVVEGPIGDPLGLLTNSIGPLKTLYLPKPDSGEYELSITSSNDADYILDQYFYDIDGGVSMASAEGQLDSGQTDTYIISFDKEDSENSSSEIVEEITFESIKGDIEEGYLQMEIGFGLRTALLSLLNNAEKAKKPAISEKMLDQMIHLISKDKNVSFEFSQELIGDINTLKEDLQ